MKKITTIVIALVVAMTITSCHGDYTCTCTFNGAEVYHQTSDDKSKKDAKTDCDLKETTVVGQTCDLD